MGGISVTLHRDDVSFSDATAIIMPYPGLEISIRNRYRYSLLFRHRMQKFSTFFS